MRLDEVHATGKAHVPVPTQEDRIAALERKIAMLKLLHSQDERKAEETIPPAQTRHMRDINDNLTILLGVTASQGEDIKGIKDRLDRLDVHSTEHTGRFDHIEALLMQIPACLPEKPSPRTTQWKNLWESL